jgi:D-alanyl-lipoteichoic acid acyltransferase DltB (MBOAT superfamily)
MPARLLPVMTDADIFHIFVVFLIFYGLLQTRSRPRLYFVLVASLVFYVAWNYRFIPLLVESSVRCRRRLWPAYASNGPDVC